MCGIAGIVAKPGSIVDTDTLEIMKNALLHRGPDGNGLTIGETSTRVSFDPIWGLAHTRLAILDPTAAAAQPMNNMGETIYITFNGEIYNFEQLRSELLTRGYAFTSTGDTQVLLAAYEEWGTDCTKRLIGMFSFMIIDQAEGLAFGARDPFGIKPFYYTDSDSAWTFSSEIKALRINMTTAHAANENVVLRYLRYGIGGDGEATTMFANIHQLPAGHSVTIDLATGSSVVERYYKLALDPMSTKDISFTEAVIGFRDRFLSSVEQHMKSDVAVGSSLSGGLDSSSIVSSIRHLYGSSVNIDCFTYVAPGSNLNEDRWATIVADATGARIHRVLPTGVDMLEDIRSVTRSMDEPLPSTSVYAQYCVFREANLAGVKVLLDGQGADEILGGYPRYLSARVAGLVRRGKVANAARLLVRARARGIAINNSAMWVGSYLAPEPWHDALRRAVGKDLVPNFIDSQWFSSRGAILHAVSGGNSRFGLRDALIEDLTVNSIPSLLRYEDRNSMASSVESRVPFLIPDVVEYCLALPEEYLIDNRGRSKAVLREAMRGLMPGVIVDRVDKIGFAPPSAEWMRQGSETVMELLLTLVPNTLPFVRRVEIEAYVSGLKSGDSFDDLVWRLLFLAIWAEEFGVVFS